MVGFQLPDQAAYSAGRPTGPAPRPAVSAEPAPRRGAAGERPPQAQRSRDWLPQSSCCREQLS